MLMATAFFRTIILYLLLIAGLRLTGKRQIGELEPIELVLTMLLSDLASVPMQDFDSPLINGVVPILTLLALTTLLSYISFRSGRFRSLICGEPAIVVRYGKLQQRAMRHNRMTVDELLEELRGQGYTDLAGVKYGILEGGGIPRETGTIAAPGPAGNAPSAVPERHGAASSGAADQRRAAAAGQYEENGRG